MFCTKCGSQVENGLKFCPKCGNSLSAGGKDQHSDGKSSARKSGIAVKVVEVVIGVLLAAGFFAYKYYTSGMSIESLERQSAELVQGAIADSGIAKFLKFEKTENLVLQKQEKDHYTGTTWVWFNRKTNPNRVPVRFKYSLDVKLSDGRVYLKTKPEDGESERMVEFIGGGEEDGETESAGGEETAEASDEETASNDEEADYRSITFEDSEKLIAQWHKLEVGRGMTSLQKEEGESRLIGKKIAVKGWVTDVRRMFDNSLCVTITNSNPLHSEYYALMQLDTDETAQALQTGDPVILCGTIYKDLLGLGLNHGCVARWEVDDNEADDGAVDVSKEYETILREAMPYFMSAQGVPKDKLDVMVAVELKKEMNQFRELTGEEKIERLKRAQGEILPMARAMKNGGPEADAIVKKLKETKEAAQAVALSAQGDALYYAITTANTQREASDVASVWPKSPYTKTTVADDISSKLFETSTEYFNELFDIRNRGKSDWKPYIDGRVDIQCAFSPDTMIANWHVAQGVTDDMADCVPVLVSSNVDVSSLVTQPGQYKASAQTGRLRFSGTCAVIIRKGGAAEVIKEKDASLAKVYGNNFSLPKGFGYLSPSAK